MGAVAAELAQVSAIAFEATPGADLAALGLHPLDFRQLDMSQGLFTAKNAAAIVATGTIEGVHALVLAFRGSDDAVDWRHDFLDIDADYPKFTKLLSAVDAYAAIHDLKVIVTGFSLGGALTQLYMAQHENHGDLTYQAVTFASPGALLSTHNDPRVTNYELVSDPLVFDGLHRKEIAEAVAADHTGQLRAELSAEILGAGIPLTQGELDAALAVSLVQGDYHNLGHTVDLHTTAQRPDPTAITGIQSLLNADPAVHDIDLYATLAAAAPDPTIVRPPDGDSPIPEGVETFLNAHPQLADALVGQAIRYGWDFL